MCARCRSCHRFISPGVIPTSTPHMDRLLGPQGIGQAGSDKVDTAEADEVIAAGRSRRTDEPAGWVIRQQVIEQLMCVVGRKDLMTKFYPAAVGDTTRTRVRQSLRR